MSLQGTFTTPGETVWAVTGNASRVPSASEQAIFLWRSPNQRPWELPSVDAVRSIGVPGAYLARIGVDVPLRAPVVRPNPIRRRLVVWRYIRAALSGVTLVIDALS